MDEYDVGLLNDWGGGNVAWWHDYLRYEIGRANSHWIQQTESLRAELAECRRQSVSLYNSGYHAGHHDTVEGCYTHILPCDMSTYHDDVVAALREGGE